MTIREAIEAIEKAAIDIYGEREARQIGRIAVMELGHYTPTQLVLDIESQCSIENIDWVVEQVRKGRPIQYIIGESEFSGLIFKVREGVLIPRPETEELVRWIVAEARGTTPRIVDVGTGSGAIAVSLAKLIEGSELWGVDISVDALSQARDNGELNGVRVNFIEGDALRGVEHYLPSAKFDIVVSNPPYIPRLEGAEIRDNVMNFEPHLALFVDDDDPLIFYHKIAESSLKILRPEGALYFEIHENFASEMVSMLSDMGYVDIECRRDINEKPRMICAHLK